MINTKKLRQAIKTADTARIKEILRDAPKEEIRLAYDWTPLHVAAKRGNRDVVSKSMPRAVVARSHVTDAPTPPTAPTLLVLRITESPANQCAQDRLQSLLLWPN